MSETPKECTWTADLDGIWETSCGEAFVTNDGTPAENKMKFCAYCGGALIEVPYPDMEMDEVEEGSPSVSSSGGEK